MRLETADAAVFHLQEGEVPYLKCAGLGTPHGFSTRLGGVSEGAYQSLNLAQSAGDDATTVAINKNRFRLALGLSRLPLTCHQIHSDQGHIVAADEAIPEPGVLKGDFLVTNHPRLPLGIYSADCAPVLLHDPVKGVVGAVHSGWRGTARAVVRVAIQAMGKAFGSLPGDLVAAVGPTIGGCCYEVGPEVVQAMESALDTAGAAADSRFIRPVADKHVVDLPAILAQQLLAAGLSPAHIHLSGVCTFCKAELCFSYRRQGAKSGRMLAIVSL